MNKKLIISLSAIATIAIIAIGATTAYFGNTETSPDNTFIAGAIDLKIDNECHYNSRACIDGYWEGTNEPCDCTWELSDLDGKAIFYFTDVKPGDNGEDTISLHVDSNPAWICAEVSNVTQMENGCNLPESMVDLTCEENATGTGELWGNLRFNIWMDDCDNIYEPGAGEEYLVENANATNLKWPIADSKTGGEPIRDACIGVEWYVPVGVGNIIQGDSVTGDITFYAYQARNNDNFLCNPPTTGNLTVIKHVEGGTAQAGDFTINVSGNNPNPSSFSGNEMGTNVSLEPGSYSVSETPLQGYSVSYSADCSGTIAAGDTKTCTVTNTVKTGTIKVHKDVINNGVGTKVADDFQMTIDGDPVAQDATITVAVGNHTVSEANNYGYVMSVSGDCAANGTVTVGDGENKNCTVTNNMPFGKLTVIKVVVNDDNGTSTIADFVLKIDGQVVTSGAKNNVSVGSHKVTETGIYGYSAKFSGACDTAGNVTIVAGDDKTCTITNDDIAPILTVVKIVDGGSALPDEFNLTVDGNIVVSGSSNIVSANAPHTINETLVTNYTFTSITGNAKCPANLGGTITLGLAESATCYITNTYIGTY